MPTSTALASFFPNFLLQRLKWSTPQCYIHHLNFDIFVDFIFTHLTIEDIVCLRRVDRFFFLLTHEPVIWKRFLERMRTPIPPLRPTFRYSFQPTDFEVEQLVTRAISLEDNWRQDTPLVKVRRTVDSHHRVLDMSLLPGGKFLVASVRDLDSHRYYLTLFSLEHPKGSCAVARLPTGSKAYDLQAKYIKYEGKQGIMIAYTKRTFLNGEEPGIDPSDYSDTDAVEPPAPLWYENVCWHVSLDTLEELVDPRVTPGSAEFQELAIERERPFRQISSFESEKRISCLSLFEMDSSPFIAFVQGPKTVVFVNLVSGVVAPMDLQNYNDAPADDHHIRTFRVIPDQRDIITIRTVRFEEAPGHVQPEHLMEMFHIPHPTDPPRPPEPEPNGAIKPFERWPVDPREYDSFHLSDPVIHSIGLDHPRLQPARPSGLPEPISLYCRTAYPAGLVHYLIWPKIIESPTGGPPQYFFNLEYVVPQTVHVSAPYSMQVLPGASRAFVFTVEDARKSSPRVLAVRRYLSPQLQPLWGQRAMEDPIEPISRRDRPPLSRKYYSAFNLPRFLRRKLDDEGLGAITWDEAIGRVCIACGDDFRIHILDFAYSVRPDDRFRAWKMAQSIKPNVVDPGNAMTIDPPASPTV
uniref:F-box domain-containing protein n=1 Tax=Mycena chlorophos TaxID=658473 RepID=A0ABQ0M952_MYCCL|nr:predicted protein [Mycena chlorophos]